MRSELPGSRLKIRARLAKPNGSETDVCVLSSILAAVDHGSRVILAEDAVCSTSDESMTR
jgi:hypothetical protein